MWFILCSLWFSFYFGLINSANINIEPDWFVWVFDIDRINYLSYIFPIIYLLPLCAAYGHEKETFAITALCKHSSLPSFRSYY